MVVSDETKLAYQKSTHKKLNIFFPDLSLDIAPSQIYKQSMDLEETLIDGSEIEFVGCISSQFSVQVSGITQDIKGQRIEVSITADDTEEIPLFHGIVDSAKKQTNKNYKKIVAYDELYTKGNIDVAPWYNSLTFPITQKDLRDSFFAYIGIEQETKALPNDSILISKEFEPATLQARVVFKSICQINGAFGIINRYGKFEYRILTEMIAESGAYPGLTLFPPFYPGVGGSGSVDSTTARSISFYKKVDYEEYSVKPVEKVTIRQSDSDIGVTYGNGTNNYIIQGNMFAVNKSEEELLDIAKNIHSSIAGVEFVPFESDNSGYPFIDVGDGVSYYTYDYEASAKARTEDVYTEKVFYVFKRTLSGIQALKDSYSVQGEEYQTEFVTDLQTQIETVKNNLKNEVATQVESKVSEITYTRDEIEDLLADMFVSVDELPEDHATTGKWYFVRGEVVVE